ncbi:glycosyl transferase [Desulfocurvibacter africanus PCS]|uniref:Glycosyl transferase n=1 Tax=Desulfocurvibacter africanus PCS TaxID=1262666 RepID=M5PU44_DESAF|nr:glycosyltransferase family 2 protein [Desulfocurvibacter africanus]EMG37535.1 glycosyl transferase [Desulfocurvibacter africanus PCS]
MTPETLVIIPAKNEQDSVHLVAGAVVSDLGLPVVVVDDASNDETADAARRAGATVLSLRLGLGAWGAMQAGIRYALSRGYKRCVTMDADGQHPVQSLPVVLEPVLRGRADAAIGSCTSRGSPLRQVAWGLFRGIGGLGVGDLTSGFRAYNRRAMELLAGPRATLLDYQDLGVLFLLRGNGLRIVETPIAMACRLSGHSRIFNTWPSVGKYMLHSSILAMSKSVRGSRQSDKAGEDQ